jgi:hypothetical protein
VHVPLTTDTGTNGLSALFVTVSGEFQLSETPGGPWGP